MSFVLKRHQSERVIGVWREKPFRLQLLAAEAHDHRLAAEIRIEADVAQRADRYAGARRIDGDAAAVSMLEPDDIVDIRKARQQFSLDPSHRILDNAGDALH